MAVFIIKQKSDPSYKRNVIDIHSRAKRHKKWLKVSFIFNIIFVLYFLYLNTSRYFNH
jgi:hypothetical protein